MLAGLFIDRFSNNLVFEVLLTTKLRFFTSPMCDVRFVILLLRISGWHTLMVVFFHQTATTRWPVGVSGLSLASYDNYHIKCLSNIGGIVSLDPFCYKLTHIKWTVAPEVYGILLRSSIPPPLYTIPNLFYGKSVNRNNHPHAECMFKKAEW